jgi:hypothetical protein
MKAPRIAALLVVSLVTLPAATQAAELALQGVLRSAGGGPVADGSYFLFVKLYDSADAKIEIWEETLKGLPVTAGFFAATVGSVPGKELPEALLSSGKPLWLGVQVGADPELPRQQLLGVPWAWHARTAAAGLFPYAAAAKPGGAATGLACTGCVTSELLADGAVTAAKVGFTYAGSDSKGGAAKSAEQATLAKQAEQATLADFAKTADQAKEAEHAKTAGKATTADEAAGLQCSGCVVLKALAGEVTAAFLPAAGGKISGSLSVAKDLEVGANLLLGNAAISGGHLTAVDVAKTTCDPASRGRIAFDDGKARLYLCDGKGWLRVSMCSELCQAPSTIPCGQSIPNGCGEAGACTGTGTMCEAGKFCVNNLCKGVGDSPETAVLSCKDLKAKSPLAKSGVYWVDPDGAVTTYKPVQTRCDMDLDGGAWTLVVRTGTWTCSWTKDGCGDANPWNPWLESYGAYEAGGKKKFSMPIKPLSTTASGSDLEVMMLMDGAWYMGYVGADLACAFYHPGTADCTATNNWSFKSAAGGAWTKCTTQKHAQSQWWGWTWTFNDHENTGNCAYNTNGTLLHESSSVYNGSKGHSAFTGYSSFEIYVR